MQETDKRLYLVEQHLKEIQKDIANITSALVGNKENGNRGFIHEIQELKQDVTELEIQMNEMKTDIAKKDVYINQLKYIVSVAVGVIVTIIITSLIK